jgi:hypothetical protein
MMILRATSSFKGDKSDTKVTYSITADTPNNTFFFFLKGQTTRVGWRVYNLKSILNRIISIKIAIYMKLIHAQLSIPFQYILKRKHILKGNIRCSLNCNVTFKIIIIDF